MSAVKVGGCVCMSGCRTVQVDQWVTSITKRPNDACALMSQCDLVKASPGLHKLN